MDNLPRIRTPWKQQWRRVRYQLVPVLTLALSILAVSWLWKQHVGVQTGLGEVDTDNRTILCPTDGILTAKYAFHPYEEIARDQAVAMLDDTQARQSLEVLQAELKRMQAEIPAKIESLRDLHGARQEDRATEERRLANKVHELNVSILDLQAKIARNNLELKRLNSDIEMATKLGAQATDLQHQRDMLTEKVKGDDSLLAESRTQLADTKKRIEAYKTIEMGDVTKQLAPLEAAIEAQQKKIAELQQHIASLEIHSPFQGRILTIHRFPGQLVRAGEPLMTIADERSGGHIKCYIRQEQRIAPQVGMKVEIRPRMPGSKAALSSIETIGPQLEQVPHHLLHDPRNPEWGVPVHIAMPPQMNLRPGELVDLLFKQDEKI